MEVAGDAAQAFRAFVAQRAPPSLPPAPLPSATGAVTTAGASTRRTYRLHAPTKPLGYGQRWPF
jgi:hypothetical protein